MCSWNHKLKTTVDMSQFHLHHIPPSTPCPSSCISKSSSALPWRRHLSTGSQEICLQQTHWCTGDALYQPKSIAQCHDFLKPICSSKPQLSERPTPSLPAPEDKPWIQTLSSALHRAARFSPKLHFSNQKQAHKNSYASTNAVSHKKTQLGSDSCGWTRRASTKPIDSKNWFPNRTPGRRTRHEAGDQKNDGIQQEQH